MIEVRNLSKTYQSATVLNLPRFSFRSGGRYIVIGANGSGKSTLARLLAGVLQPDPDSQIIRDGNVGYMPQKSLGFHLSVERNLLLTAPKDSEGRERLESLMAKLGLDSIRCRDGGSLSGGETAKLALARLLLRRWGTLILDEPTAAMDVAAAIRAEECILRFQQESGCTLIMITHALGQARRMGDELLFFHGGALWEHGPAEQLLHCPQREETVQFLQFGTFL